MNQGYLRANRLKCEIEDKINNMYNNKDLQIKKEVNDFPKEIKEKTEKLEILSNEINSLLKEYSEIIAHMKIDLKNGQEVSGENNYIQIWQRFHIYISNIDKYTFFFKEKIIISIVFQFITKSKKKMIKRLKYFTTFSKILLNFLLREIRLINQTKFINFQRFEGFFLDKQLN